MKYNTFLILEAQHPDPLKNPKNEDLPQYEPITTFRKLRDYQRVPFWDPLGGLGEDYTSSDQVPKNALLGIA